MQLFLYVYKFMPKIGHRTILFSWNQHNFNTRNVNNLSTSFCRLKRKTKQAWNRCRVLHVYLPRGPYPMAHCTQNEIPCVNQRPYIVIIVVKCRATYHIFTCG